MIEIYRLDAISRKTVKDTPEAKRMLQDIRDGHIESPRVFRRPFSLSQATLADSSNWQ